jgi:endothelin-converting enzyme
LTPELGKKNQKSDTHSPAFARINIALGNYPEFAKAFKCKKGSKMNIAEKRCEVW